MSCQVPAKTSSITEFLHPGHRVASYRPAPPQPRSVAMGVWGAMEQKVHLSPVPVLKPACCLDSSIKRPFYETALTNIRKDRKHPKSGSINSFRQSEFSNQQSHTSKANSNSCLRWFSVPLLPKPHPGPWLLWQKLLLPRTARVYVDL